MKINVLVSIILIALTVTSCGGFKAKRVDANESDDKAMEITDKWVNRDTELTVKKILLKAI